MIHPEDRRGAEISRFSAFILYQTVVFLLLTPFCGGQSQAIDQHQIIVALAGDNIILPCHLVPAVDAVSMTVEWARPDLNPRFVHVRRDGVELLIDQNPSYIGRTSMSIKQLKCGDISLKLSKVKLSDEGTYRCHIPTQRATSVVTLAVGSVSSPSLRLSKLNDAGSGLQLDCESKGWYPEPEVLWLDGEGNLLSAGPPETVRGPDDLYTVSSRVTVEKRHSNRFTCRVQQKNINQTREAHIHVPDYLFVVPSCSVGRIIIVLVVGFMCVLAVVLGIFIMGRKINKPHDDKTELGEQDKTKKKNPGHQSLIVSQEETSQLLKREKEKLGEELEKNKGELKEALVVLDKLRNHKEDLKNHKEQVSSILNEIIDKKIKRDEDKKTKRERRNETRKKMLEEAVKLIETTEEMIIKMTEMKTRLEKDKEQVHKQLKAKLKDEQFDTEELN